MAEDKGVLKTEVHAAAADRGMQMGRVAGEKDAADLQVVVDAVRDVEAGFPDWRSGGRGVDQVLERLRHVAEDTPQGRLRRGEGRIVAHDADHEQETFV